MVFIAHLCEGACPAYDRVSQCDSALSNDILKSYGKLAPYSLFVELILLREGGRQRSNYGRVFRYALISVVHIGDGRQDMPYG